MTHQIHLLGDALVIRNVGGRVTPAVLDILDLLPLGFPAQIGPTSEGAKGDLIVLHHNQCGQTFPDRAARAKAIGAWGASAGAAVAIGPVVGGLLLTHFSWVSVFAAMVPVAVVALVGALLVVPADRQPTSHRLDVRGLTVAAMALGSLVYTINQAPDAGSSSLRTIGGFVVAAIAFGVLVIVERGLRSPH